MGFGATGTPGHFPHPVSSPSQPSGMACINSAAYLVTLPFFVPLTPLGNRRPFIDQRATVVQHPRLSARFKPVGLVRPHPFSAGRTNGLQGLVVIMGPHDVRGPDGQAGRPHLKEMFDGCPPRLGCASINGESRSVKSNKLGLPSCRLKDWCSHSQCKRVRKTTE